MAQPARIGPTLTDQPSAFSTDIPAEQILRELHARLVGTAAHARAASEAHTLIGDHATARRCTFAAVAAEQAIGDIMIARQRADTTIESAGATLARALDQRGWTQTQFAGIIDRPLQTVNEIITGKKQITHQTAAQLAAALDTTPQFWLERQHAFHLHAQTQDPALQDKLARIRERAAALNALSEGALQKLVDASPHLPNLAELTTPTPHLTPKAGELWRAGRGEAVLVWIREVHPEHVEINPVTLDVDHVGDDTLIVAGYHTPLGADIGVMAAIRAKVTRKALINRICDLDVARVAIIEMLDAVHEGRLPDVPTGNAVDADMRAEHRLAIMSTLLPLAPAHWTEE